MSKKLVIHWFRQDLRLTDNPALSAACQQGQVLPIYILDDTNAGEYTTGAATNWWLHNSLHALNASLNGTLSVYRGNPHKILLELCERLEADTVYWNRCYEPWQVQRDKQIKADLVSGKLQAATFNGSLLWEPGEVLKKDGTPYKVFTPYYQRGCLSAKSPRTPLSLLTKAAI